MDNHKYFFKHVLKYVNFINNKFNLDVDIDELFFDFDFNKYFDIKFNFNIDFFNNNCRLMKKPTYVPHLSVYIWASQFIYGKRVLDIGCGDGYGMVVTSMFASSIRGLDFSPQAVQRARKHQYGCRVNIDQFDLEKEKINEEFDVCLAFEVLEHIDNPKEVVEQMKGKTLIFSVPHAYPHRLHKTDYYSLEDAQKLVPGWNVDWYYLSGTNITKEKPEKINRYIGIATM